MSRLDDIVERNRNPRRAIRKMKSRRGVGLTGLVLFVVLILLIFTDLGGAPDEPQPTATPPKSRTIRLGGPREQMPTVGSGAVK